MNGEDKLALARTALQSVSNTQALFELKHSDSIFTHLEGLESFPQDTKRLESGIQFINEAEIASYLLECENILRQQVVDIQVLLDGKFPFADQLVQR